MSNFLTFQNIMSLAVTGILSVFWWDVRSIRKDKDAQKKENFETFLTKDTHELLCTNAFLRVEATIQKAVDASKQEIIEAINNKKP